MPEQALYKTKPDEETLITKGQPFREDLASGGSGRAAEESEDEVDVLGLALTILRNKGTVLRIAIVATVLVLIVVLLIPSTYTAEATFLPPNSLSSSSSALLEQLGSLGAMGGALGSLKDPSQIYIGILGSRTVADNLIRQFGLQKVYREKKLSRAEKELASRSKFASGKDSIVTVSVEDHDPKRAADLANAYLTELHTQNDRLALTEAAQKRLFFEQQLVAEKDQLANAEVDLARTQEQTGLIQPGGQAELQISTIAQTQAEIAFRQVQLASLSQGATEQNPDVIRLRSEIAGLRTQLSKLENSSDKSRVGNVQEPISKVPELTLVYVRKEREVKYHEALYDLLLRQYEVAKLDESRSAPMMQVVDNAVVPDTKSGPHRTLLILLGAFFGLILGIVWVVARERTRMLAQDPESSVKLAALREAATHR